MGHPPSASVVIATWDRPLHVRRAVDSVVPQLRARDEVVIVDNGLADAERASLEDAWRGLEVRVVGETRPGVSAARNRGAREARGGLVAFLDDDATAPPGWVDAMRSALADGRYAGVAGSARLPADLPLPPWYPRRYGFLFGEIELGPRPFDFEGRLAPPGGNLCLRRSTFLEVGGFSDAVGRVRDDAGGGEEVLFVRRLLRCGHRIRYLPELSITHHVSPTRLTRAYMIERALRTGRDDARIERATNGGAAVLLRGALKAARVAADVPMVLWRTARSDARAGAEHAARVAMLRGYFEGTISWREGRSGENRD